MQKLGPPIFLMFIIVQVYAQNTPCHLTGPNGLHVGNDTTICSAGSVQLNATGGMFGYSWRPAAGLSDSTIANPVAIPAHTTSYIVTSYDTSGNLVVNGNFSAGNVGFTSFYAYNTNLGPANDYCVGPNPQAFNGWPACPDHTTGTGNMMVINGSGTPSNAWCETVTVLPNTNYAFSCWGQSVSDESPAQLQFSINGVALGSVLDLPLTTCVWEQFYIIWNSGTNTRADICVVDQNTAYNGNDFALDDISFSGICEIYDTITITVSNGDTTVIDTTVCQNTTYYYPDGTLGTVTGTHTMVYNTQSGCDSNVIVNLVVLKALDTVNATICSGTKYQLPTGVYTTQAGTYHDTLVAPQCTSVTITNLTVTPPPVGTQFDTICQGSTFIRPSGISEAATGSYTDTLKTAGGCDSIVISMLTVNPTSSQTVIDTICQGTNFSLPNGTAETESGTYPVTLTNIFGCDSSITTVLTVINDVLTVNETGVLCAGDTNGAIAAAAGGGLSPYLFLLTQNGNYIDSNGTGNFPNHPPGNYLVTVTDNFGCTKANAAVIPQPLPLLLSATPVNISCYGNHDGSAQIAASGGTGPYVYTMDGQTNSTGNFAPLDTGTYAYSVTDAHGCFDTGSLSIHQPPPITLSVLPDSITLNLGQSRQINASSNYDPNTTYQWSPASGLSCAQCPNPVAGSVNTQLYTVTVTSNINGDDCTADGSVFVTVIPNYDIYIPNAFTPDGTGINDVFSVFGNLAAVKFFSIKIFDRWGEKVYESSDVNFKWDGNFKGKPLAMQVLVYEVQLVFEDNHTDKLYKGSITLLR